MSSLESYDLDLFDVESGSDQQHLLQHTLEIFEGMDKNGNPEARFLEQQEQQQHFSDREGALAIAESPGMELSLSDSTTQDKSRGSKPSAGGRKRKFSKNLLSERKRRQKLNEKLYSLRAIVPKITKMDKASIMADAIGYVEELKAQVSNMRREISGMELLSNLSPNSSLTTASSPEASVEDDDRDRKRHRDEQRNGDEAIRIDVEKMDESRTCLVRFRCCPKVLAEIVGALESLDLEVLSASINSFQGQVFSTYMAKVRDERLMKKENLEGLVWNAVKLFV